MKKRFCNSVLRGKAKEKAMRKLSIEEPSCLTIQGKQPGDWQQHDKTTKTPSRFGWIVLIVMTLMLLVPAAAMSKGPGGKKGGGTTPTEDVIDYGDIFGDLIHILRDPDTGQPIFAQRWVEMPAELPGYGWGYCAIGVDADNAEIPFAPYSCDLAPADPEDVVEVDYFGRLNGARVQERNIRMHFDETISNIKQAGQVKLDPTGRLMLGFECELNDNPGTCSWATVDSPMESLGLYWRMMKYGHIATSPTEVDLWWHGDPKLTTPYHPALDADDFDKLDAAGLENLLPKKSYSPENLTFEDFNTSAAFLGAAGGKHNFFTEHLVQYLNRFLRITQTTDFSASTLKTLPAMYQSCDCYKDGELLVGDPWMSGEEAPEWWDLGDVVLTYENCVDLEVDQNIPNYADFSNVQERFMNFGASDYARNTVWGGKTATLALESSPGIYSGIWRYDSSVSLLEWIVIPNPAVPAAMDIHNFVDAASDALRAIEYIHNYEVPENLYCTYDDWYCL